MFPIHRKDQLHWVLATVHLTDGRIVLFDSFGQSKWADDLQVHGRSPFNFMLIFQILACGIRLLKALAESNSHFISRWWDRWTAIQATVRKFSLL
jgi:hypothetical protein